MKWIPPLIKHILLARKNWKIYTGEGLNRLCLFDYANEAEQLYTIVDIARVRDKRSLIGTVLVARLANDQVIIELDRLMTSYWWMR